MHYVRFHEISNYFTAFWKTSVDFKGFQINSKDFKGFWDKDFKKFREIAQDYIWNFSGFQIKISRHFEGFQYISKILKDLKWIWKISSIRQRFRKIEGYQILYGISRVFSKFRGIRKDFKDNLWILLQSKCSKEI